MPDMNPPRVSRPTVPLVLFLLASGTVFAGGVGAQETAGSALETRTVSIAPFTSPAREDRWQRVAGTIPGLLEAGFLPFGWIRPVRWEGPSPVVELSRAGTSKADYTPQQVASTRESRGGAGKVPVTGPDADFWIRGQLIPVRQGAVIDVSVVSGRTRSVVYTDVVETSVDELLPSVGKLARRIGERLRRDAAVDDPITPGAAANIVVVRGFRPEDGADRFASLGDILAEHLVSSLESMAASDPGRRLEVGLAKDPEGEEDPGMAQVSGAFRVVDDQEVVVTGRLVERDGGLSVPVRIRGRVDDVFALPHRLAENIFELLQARVDADGTRRPPGDLLLGSDAESLLQRGEELARGGDLPGAALHYRKAIELDPARVEGYLRLGEAYTEGGRFDEALAVLDEASRIDPASLAIDVAVADLHLRRGNVEDAANRIRTAATGSGGDTRLRARAQTLLGDALRLSGESAAALEAYEEALHLDPSNPAPYRSAADLYRTLGDPESAVDVLEDGRKSAEDGEDVLAAELAAAHNEAGEVRLEAGRVDRAEGHWERAVELAEPGSRTMAIALRFLGNSAAYGREEPDYERATEFLQRSVAADPDDPWTHHLLGLVHLDSGRMDAALEELRTAAELDPSELTYGDLGRAYRMSRDLEESAEALQRAVEIAPDFAWGHAELGETYRLMGENEDAARALERAIEIDPDYAWAWGTLGQVRHAQGDLDAALTALEKGASLDDSQTWILMELGELHRVRGEMDRAIPPLERALDRDPENAWTLGTLGQVYRAQGRSDDAVEALEEAASLDGGDLPWIHAELGQIYLGRGDVDRAIESFRTAIDLAPEEESYYSWLWLAYMEEDRHADLAEEFERLAEEHPGIPRIRSLLGHLYHDFLLEYDRALEHLEEAFSLAPESPDQAANLAEAYLTNERFAIAYDLASRIIDEHHGGGEHEEELSPSADLSMRFVVIASLILQDRTAEARLELGEFLRHFRAHVEDGFDQTWDYSGTKAFVAGREIEPESRELLLLVVDVLESGEAGALEKLESFLGITKKG